MNRRLVWLGAGALLLAATGGVALAIAEGSRGGVFIAGDRPVTEEQIRQKLQAEGYSNLHIVRQARYFEATGLKDGTTAKIVVDSQTGRFHDADDDD